VNEGKYRILSTTLEQAFHKESRALEPIQVGDPLLAASPHLVDIPNEAGYQDEEEDNDWLEISLDANLMFAAGSVSLAPAAKAVLDRTAAYLRGFDNPVTVEGYTDNVPVSGRYSSNWALSSARAALVADYLAGAGVDHRRLAAVGYGKSHALATNATPDGRASNRRVVIVIAREGNQPRNLNAGGSSAFAFVRQGEAADLSTPDGAHSATPSTPGR